MKKVSRKVILFLLLVSLNAQAKYSISGISSGGFMAAQMVFFLFENLGRRYRGGGFLWLCW